ncbi:MAG: NdvB [Candidatus Gallionella acididurans]|uniref:NdvB n=1 Tax=Candidatus Gallionella acididurans TaxID=1796491 RepID=A0A139BP03_9PROT|nr:MAG: NdvB [Candidatus Gallionella acididurans]
MSDVYQDMFGEGSFIGKGIYDVDAFRQAVDGRFPDNLILSHDLLESGYARSALVTDVDLIEEHPDSYAIDVSRRHRWIRGDWQLAGWLLPSVPGPNQKNEPKPGRQLNPLSALSRWKIFDNLRRSLVSPALLVLLIGGWLFGPKAAWFWSLLVATIIFLPGTLSKVIEFIRKPKEHEWLVHLVQTTRATGHPVAHALLTMTLLPYEAVICLDAIMRSGARMLFTRRGLMLWHMKSYSIRNARHTLGGFVREMWIAPVIALALALSMSGSELIFSAPFLLLWLASPLVGWWISKPLLSPAQGLMRSNACFCAHRHDAPGASSRTSSVLLTTGCRPTIIRKNQHPPSHRALRRPTSACRCWQICLPVILATFALVNCCSAWKTPWQRWKSWSVTVATFITGTTHTR